MVTRGSRQAERGLLNTLGEVAVCLGSYVGTEITELGGLMLPRRRVVTHS